MGPKFLKNLIQRQEFHPSPFFGVWINPFYLIRSGLNRDVKELSSLIHGKVLDVGCGSKPYQEFFKNCSYTGLDVEMSRERFGDRVDVYFDGGDFPFDSAVFDAVISFEVLEHVPNTHFFLEQVNRVLKKGGKVLLTVPLCWEEHEVPHDYFRFTTFGLKSCLEKNGFKIIEHKRSTTGLLAAVQLATGNWTVPILSKHKLIKHGFQVFWVAPIHFIALVIAKIFPGHDRFYLNNVILAEKV